MARVVALVPDLLFGSRVVAALEAAGHDVTLTAQEDEARAQIEFADVLVVDLNADAVDGVMLVDSMHAGGELRGRRTLGFYAHVETGLRDRARVAGFDMVVPRSRMAREAAALVAGLLSRGDGEATG
jgi:CheY-like chemotaxis protein